jgi:hypothetical protein
MKNLVKWLFRTRNKQLDIPVVSGNASINNEKYETELRKAWVAGARNTKFKEHPSSQTFDEWYSQHYR